MRRSRELSSSDFTTLLDSKVASPLGIFYVAILIFVVLLKFDAMGFPIVISPMLP